MEGSGKFYQDKGKLDSPTPIPLLQMIDSDWSYQLNRKQFRRWHRDETDRGWGTLMNRRIKPTEKENAEAGAQADSKDY